MYGIIFIARVLKIILLTYKYDFKFIFINIYYLETKSTHFPHHNFTCSLSARKEQERIRTCEQKN